MTIDNKIRDEKLQYNINREAAKLSALSFGKIDKYDYLTVEEILPLGQKRVIEQAKFKYSSLGFANQSKRLAILTNKDDNKGNYKEIFEGTS